MSKDKQKQALINMVKADEDLGLYRREELEQMLHNIASEYNAVELDSLSIEAMNESQDKLVKERADQIEELYKPK